MAESGNCSGPAACNRLTDEARQVIHFTNNHTILFTLTKTGEKPTNYVQKLLFIENLSMHNYRHVSMLFVRSFCNFLVSYL